MNEIWGYPYRLGITIFVLGGTAFLTIAFVAFAVWMERSFKKDKIKK
jgi:hypothetical protein